MKAISNGRIIVLSAIIFTFFFYNQSLGLNLMIYEFLILIVLFAQGAIHLKNNLHIFSLLTVVSTVVFTVLHHSLLSFVVNFACFFVLVGVLAAPEIRSIPFSAFNSLTTLIISQGMFPKEFSYKQKSKQGNRKSLSLRRLSIFIVPVLIIITFIFIYSASNPKFGEFFTWLTERIHYFFNLIFKDLNFNIVFVFILGIMFGSYFFLRQKNNSMIDQDSQGNDTLLRVKDKQRRYFKILGLFNEYRAAIFLFISLNLLLAFLNTMDIYYVWFNFKWEGQYLKDFVHQGTYLLLVSVLLSIGLVLYFFRKNINFFSKNGTLKKLSYVWIVQNAILVVSVGIRNWYYINYYALAYKRIAIVFFLLFTLFVLFTVFIKIYKGRSAYYMFRVNSIAFLLVFVIASGFNWDRIIAHYNFSKADQSFVHLNYLQTMADSALPELDVPIERLKEVDTRQMKQYSNYDANSFGSGSLNIYRLTYLSPEEFVNTINYRKKAFKDKWEHTSWLSWNLAEQQAYDQLF